MASNSATALLAATQEHPRDATDEAIRFSVIILLASLVLQRFALPFGGLPLNVVGPIGLVLAVYYLWTGALVLDQRRVAALLILAAASLLGTLVSVALSITRLPVPTWTSLSQFLLLCSFAVVTFRDQVDEKRFFRAVNACHAFIGIAGILQFAVQFSGLSMFTFRGYAPDSLLYPDNSWNDAYQIPGSHYMKANGFFLVEPSVYSQVMAIGLAIEIVYFRRLSRLAIFSLGLVLSVSGTGWMVLGAFVAGAVTRMGGRGLAIGIGTVVCGLLALGVLSVALPDVFEVLLSRVDEFSSPGSSGHQRFITPWWVLAQAIEWAPWTAFVGLGAGTSERLILPYQYGMSTPLKIVIEYGLPALGAFFALFLAANRTPGQSAILPAALMWFLFTGTYVQFPPILYSVLLLVAVARLRQSPAAAPQ